MYYDLNSDVSGTCTLQQKNLSLNLKAKTMKIQMVPRLGIGNREQITSTLSYDGCNGGADGLPIEPKGLVVTGVSTTEKIYTPKCTPKF